MNWIPGQARNDVAEGWQAGVERGTSIDGRRGHEKTPAAMRGFILVGGKFRLVSFLYLVLGVNKEEQSFWDLVRTIGSPRLRLGII